MYKQNKEDFESVLSYMERKGHRNFFLNVNNGGEFKMLIDACGGRYYVERIPSEVKDKIQIKLIKLETLSID